MTLLSASHGCRKVKKDQLQPWEAVSVLGTTFILRRTARVGVVMLLVARTVAVVVVVVLAGHPHTVEAKIGTFWHVTDFHYDLNYTTSGDPKRMCWDTRFSSGSVGEFGDYDCDAPFPLLTSAVDAMKKFDGEPDFILWTGCRWVQIVYNQKWPIYGRNGFSSSRDMETCTTASIPVYLVGHIPPGTFERYQQKRKGFHWYQPRYNDRFTQLVQQHAHVIEAQFFAHHHTDSFRLFFEEEKNQEQRIPVSYQLLSPGVTPWRSTLSEETGANNPGIRLVHYNTTTGKVVDVSTYYLNLSAANLEGRAEWHLEYNFSSTYNLKSVSPVALYEVAKTMKANRTLFDLYYRANTVGLEDPEKCTEKCRLLHWCAITEINYSRFYDCNNGVRLSWRAALGVVASVLVLVVR